ncbi:MAG TPA: CAP domain-containing protein, partial [Gemmataceae bacterium]|nr:CAP domain-containing protein [Gemmataceae bacterium]
DCLAWNYGIPSPRPRVVVTTLDTEEAEDIATALHDPLSDFVGKATHGHYGFATLRLGKKSTRVVLLMWDAPVDLDKVPRHLAANSQGSLKGKLLAPAQNVKLLVSDAVGNLTTVPQQGEDIQADVKCGDKAGTIQIEAVSEEGGTRKTLFGFPIYCGSDVPASVALTKPEDWPADSTAQGKKMFEMINSRRTAAGLKPLVWEDAVATAAQGAAEALRQNQNTPPDPAVFLKKAGVNSPSVVPNLGLALTAEDAEINFEQTPAQRANLMSPEMTHVGIGLAPSKDSSGRATVYAYELFVQELAAADPEAVRKELREKVLAKRTAAHAAAAVIDAAMDAAAQKYAAAMAAAGGDVSDSQGRQILNPVTKVYHAMNIISGVKSDPLAFADDAGVSGKAQVIGVGAANGTSTTLGKNSTFVVILLGAKK